MAPTTQPSNQAAGIYSKTFNIYARNFGKLFLIFVLFISVLAIPLFIFLPAYVAKINESVQAFDALAMYMVVYMLTSLIAPIAQMIVMMCAIGVFAAPYAMGIAGKIISDGMEGESSPLIENFIWAGRNYKKLLSAYAIYYALFGVFAILCYIILTGLMASSHVIVEFWFNPVLVMLIAGLCVLLLGTVYVPFGVIDGKKGGLRSVGSSFKIMYSKSFLTSFANLLASLGIVVGFVFLAQLPYFYPFLIKHPDSSRFNNFIAFVNNLSSDIIYILFAIVIYSLAGVFLYIFAYNTYRSAKSLLAGRGGKK
jgi:hypothetical protein